MESVPSQLQKPVRRQRAPWVVLLTSAGLTVMAGLVVANVARERDEARFRNAVQAADDRIAGRIDVYIASLRGGAALFTASENVTTEEFHRYVERLDVHRRYPGIQAIGYSERSESGFDDDYDERHSIRYIYPPNERNRAALGFDMYQDVTRRVAMRRARDLAEPAMSGPVRLVQEIDPNPQPGFLIYLPVYAMGQVPPTVEERRRQLKGFVYAPFRANDLFSGIFGSEQFPRVSFTVFNGSTPDTLAILYESARAAGHEPAHSGLTQLHIAGGIWTVRYASQPQFEQASGRSLVPAGVLVGLLFSLWLFWLARRLSSERQVAEAASHAKSAFLANMSHELRTPLNAIGGYVDLMQLGIPEPVTTGQQEYLARIQRAQQHLLTLINNVLNFAKLEAGRTEFRVEPAHVADMVSDAVSMILPSAEAVGLTLISNGGPDVWVSGDDEKIRQVLLNLLANAIKFTDPGGEVEVSWRTDADHVELAVRDTGIGIDQANHERIFDAFVQANSDLTRDRQGTGLGLSISRALAQGMGGDIHVVSSPGAGSTFMLTLPRASENEGRG